MTKKTNKKVDPQHFIETDSTFQDELAGKQALYTKQPAWIQRFLDAGDSSKIWIRFRRDYFIVTLSDGDNLFLACENYFQTCFASVSLLDSNRFFGADYQSF